MWIKFWVQPSETIDLLANWPTLSQKANKYMQFGFGMLQMFTAKCSSGVRSTKNLDGRPPFARDIGHVIDRHVFQFAL